MRELEQSGVVRIDSVLQQPAALLKFVNEALEEALHAARYEDLSMDFGDVAASQRFGNVMARVNRHDLKLSIEPPPVRAAVADVLRSVGPTFRACLGEDAELYELAALISDPKAPGQPIHPDTPQGPDEEKADVLTAFVALQDIEQDMGPTLFVPASHTAEAHAAFDAKDDDGASKAALLRRRPSWRGVMAAGDATLFDSRLLHCGCANESERRRVLFYASFKRKGAPAPPGTLLYELRGQHTLGALSKELCH